MIQATAGFIVYGVHKDGLKDPMGAPFIDSRCRPLARRPAGSAESGSRNIPS